ncbi:MAG: glycosyltransferase family 4 protein [Acetobacteraceae bacterium]|nr:glycosyltransferase family 4 protein [Acetobacteraceae bacterium]
MDEAADACVCRGLSNHEYSDKAPRGGCFPVRAEPFKGIADAVEAAAILRARYGDGVRIAAFGARKAALPEWIEWHDRPSQAGLRRFYNAQSVFMLPSHFEGWGLTGVEALACGAALVTADNGGSRDYALDGATALVVPPKRPERLADAVDRLFQDEDLCARLARAGHDYVQRYTWQEAGDRLERVLTGGGA